MIKIDEKDKINKDIFACKKKFKACSIFFRENAQCAHSCLHASRKLISCKTIGGKICVGLLPGLHNTVNNSKVQTMENRKFCHPFFGLKLKTYTVGPQLYHVTLLSCWETKTSFCLVKELNNVRVGSWSTPSLLGGAHSGCWRLAMPGAVLKLQQIVLGVMLQIEFPQTLRPSLKIE